MSTFCPGNDGDSLPPGTLVFRIGKKSHLSPAALRQSKASPAMFELSSTDKASPGQRLSVWVEELTVADQAWDIMGSQAERTVVACLRVDAIRAIPSQPGFTALEVEWEQALMDLGNGKTIPNPRPGAEGHAGIAGLNQGGEGKTHSKQRKGLRSALAAIADISPVPVPHNIPEAHIRLAAYFIHEKSGARNAPPEVHWINAIRKLRRTRVQQQKALETTRLDDPGVEESAGSYPS